MKVHVRTGIDDGNAYGAGYEQEYAALTTVGTVVKDFCRRFSIAFEHCIAKNFGTELQNNQIIAEVPAKQIEDKSFLTMIMVFKPSIAFYLWQSFRKGLWQYVKRPEDASYIWQTAAIVSSHGGYSCIVDTLADSTALSELLSIDPCLPISADRLLRSSYWREEEEPPVVVPEATQPVRHLLLLAQILIHHAAGKKKTPPNHTEALALRLYCKRLRPQEADAALWLHTLSANSQLAPQSVAAPGWRRMQHVLSESPAEDEVENKLICLLRGMLLIVKLLSLIHNIKAEFVGHLGEAKTPPALTALWQTLSKLAESVDRFSMDTKHIYIEAQEHEGDAFDTGHMAESDRYSAETECLTVLLCEQLILLLRQCVKEPRANYQAHRCCRTLQALMKPLWTVKGSLSAAPVRSKATTMGIVPLILALLDQSPGKARAAFEVLKMCDVTEDTKDLLVRMQGVRRLSNLLCPDATSKPSALAKEVFTILPESPQPIQGCLHQAKHMSEVVGVIRWIIEDQPKPNAAATLQQADAASGPMIASQDSSTQQSLGQSVSKLGQLTIGDLLNLDASVSNSGRSAVGDQINIDESVRYISADSGQLNLPGSVGDHEQSTAGDLHKLDESVGNDRQSTVDDLSDSSEQLKADPNSLAKLPQPSSGLEPVRELKTGPLSDSDQQDLTVPLTEATQPQTLTNDRGYPGAPLTSATEMVNVPTAGNAHPPLGAAAGTDNLSTDTHLLAPNEPGKALPSKKYSNQQATAETTESCQQSVGKAPARGSSVTALKPAQPDSTQQRSAEVEGESELVQQAHAVHESKCSDWALTSIEDLPTPSQIAWQGLESIALRAAVALQWVVALRPDVNPSRSTDESITDQGLQETLVSQLVWLFHNMLAGHWHDMSLNMNRIFQLALAAPLHTHTASQADVTAALLPMLQRLATDEGLVKAPDAPQDSWQQQQQHQTGIVLAAMFWLCCLATSEKKFKNPPSQALRSAVIQGLYAWFSVDSQCAFLSANKADLAPASWCGALQASDNIADRLNLCACYARLCSQAAAKSGYPEMFGNLGFQAKQATHELQVATFHIETLSNLPALSEVPMPWNDDLCLAVIRALFRCWESKKFESQPVISFKVPMLQQLIFLIQNMLTLTPVQSLRQRLMLVCANCMSQLLEEDLAQSPDAQAAFKAVVDLIPAYFDHRPPHLDKVAEAEIGLPSFDFTTMSEAVLNAAVLYMTSRNDWQYFRQHALVYSSHFYTAMVTNQMKITAADKDANPWPELHALFGYLAAFGTHHPAIAGALLLKTSQQPAQTLEMLQETEVKLCGYIRMSMAAALSLVFFWCCSICKLHQDIMSHQQTLAHLDRGRNNSEQHIANLKGARQSIAKVRQHLQGAAVDCLGKAQPLMVKLVHQPVWTKLLQNLSQPGHEAEWPSKRIITAHDFQDKLTYMKKKKVLFHLPGAVSQMELFYSHMMGQEKAEDSAASVADELVQQEAQAAAKAAAKKAKKQKAKAKKKQQGRAAAAAPAEQQAEPAEAAEESSAAEEGADTAAAGLLEAADKLSVGGADATVSSASDAVNLDPQADFLRKLFSCPITKEVMVDPVIAGDGHTYERAAIVHWLEGSSLSPVTSDKLPHTRLTPNVIAKSALQQHAQQS